MRFKDRYQPSNAEVEMCALFATRNCLKLQEMRKVCFYPLEPAARPSYPFPRFPPLEAFGHRPPVHAAPLVSGRHPKPLYEREVVKAFPHGFDRRSHPFVWPPAEPHPFVPTRNISTSSRAGPVKDGRRAVRATRAEFPGHSLTGLSTTTGSGASGSLSPPVCPQDIEHTRLYGEHPTDIKHLSTSVAPPSCEALSAGPAPMSMGSCDDRITLYPAAPLRLATLLHARTIAREGWGSSSQRQIGEAKSAMGFASHASDPPNAPLKERWNR